VSEVLLAAEVMAKLKVGSATLHRWCNETRAGLGTFPLPFNEPGKQRRWLASSINDWLERQHVPSPMVSPAKERRLLLQQQAETQRVLEKHYPHRKAERNS